MISARFRGDLVYLTAEEPETLARALSTWARDSEYWRLQAGGPGQLNSVHTTRKWLEEAQVKVEADFIILGIHKAEDDRLIGEIGLDGINLQHGTSYVGISLGDRQDWGQGYGTQAMCLLLDFAFNELNLHRVSLTVFEYNPRGMRSYEKAGFKYEGRLRAGVKREGKNWDIVYMGILREEWEANK